MAEPGYLKSLKPFSQILESAEAEYRDAAAGEREGVIADIISQIQAAAMKKKVTVASDEILCNVSTCTPSLYRP